MPVHGIYSGFDPTAKSLHIGNIIPILGLILSGKSRIQPYALIGTATTLIGDPTGRKNVKDILSESEIRTNAEMVKAQIGRVYSNAAEYLNFCDIQTLKFVDNYDWFNSMRLVDFLSDFGRLAKISSMLSRNSVQSRLNSEDGLNFCEFTYQLMQGYDFYHLRKHFDVNVQIGGSDQWGNMISGTDFVFKKTKESAGFITMPLLTTPDGAKMGKSAGNGVWLDSGLTCVYDFYQYFASMEDENAIHILPIMCLRDENFITQIGAEHANNPSAHVVQKFLAVYLTKLVHGTTLASEAEMLSNIIFSKKDPSLLLTFDLTSLLDSNRFRKLPISALASDQMSSFQLAKAIFPEMSNSQIKNMIKSGGLRLNHKIISPEDSFYAKDLQEICLFSYGKTSFFVVKLEKE